MEPIDVTQINTKEKTDLIKKVSRLNLSKKHDKVYQKIMEKGLKNWNENDIEFLMLLLEIYYIPMLSLYTMNFSSSRQEEVIRRQAKAKRENAARRLTEEPYSSWIKNVRNYK